MCGIVVKNLIGERVVANEFEQQLNALSHRGPDDSSSAYFRSGSLALGHTRLSFVDLSDSGRQPMTCGEYSIVFNGEIYNFIELRTELEANGVKFISRTDTEVILRGYAHEGQEFFNRLVGMFAIVIYDHRNESLVLARDQSGVKQLYIYCDEKELVFASEVKLFRHFKVDKDSQALFLLLGYVPEPRTIYSGVTAMESGAICTYCCKTNTLISKSLITYNGYSNAASVEECLEQAVKRHLRADVPVGIFLSGGVDSTVLTRFAGKSPMTVSLNFDTEENNEREHQVCVSEKLHTQHFEKIISYEVFRASLDDFFNSMDNPTIDGLNVYFVSKVAKELGLKSCLSGVGADELLNGYPSFRRAPLLYLMSFFPKSIINTIASVAKQPKLNFLNIGNRYLGMYLVNRSLFSPDEIANILDMSIEAVNSLILDLSKQYTYNKGNDLFQRVGFLECHMYMKNQLLRDADIFGMANNIEIRVPFLDQEFYEQTTKLSSISKFSFRYNKPILVEMIKGLGLEKTYTRKKAGFVLPYNNWLKKCIGELDIDESYIQRFEQGNMAWSKLWALIVLEKFK